MNEGLNTPRTPMIHIAPEQLLAFARTGAILLQLPTGGAIPVTLVETKAGNTR